MNTKIENNWQLLAQHEQWIIDYQPHSRMVRMRLDDMVMYVERESYELLWGVITQGLDELERQEDPNLSVRGSAEQSQSAWLLPHH